MKLLKSFFYLCLPAIVCGCLSPAYAQCPARTTISETLYNADGTLAAGRIVIAWPAFSIGACQVPAGQTTVPVTSGAVNVQLYPNTTAAPAGTSYRATYYLKSGRVTTEYWVVPASGSPVSLAAVRTATVPVPNVMFSQSQVTNLSTDLARKVELPSLCPSGKFLQSNGSASVPQVDCVDGTTGGGGGSGTVTSVGLAMPPQFNVSGSPVTSSGTLTATWQNQSANLFFAGPAAGVAAPPAFRALADADVPDDITLTNLTQVGTRNYTDLQNVPGAFMPVPHALDGAAHTTSGLTAGHYLKALTPSTFGFAQITFSDIAGSVTDVQVPDNITINLAAAANALAADPADCAGNNFARGINASGTAQCAQPSFSNLSGSIALSHTALTLRGDLLTVDSTPALVRLGLGANNAVLASNGSDPAWTAPTGGGSVLGTGRTLTGGAGIVALGDLSADRTISTASGEADFLASGALTCGTATQGRMQVHTTPLQYCDNAATPLLRYAADGDSTGAALSGDSATAFFAAGTLEDVRLSANVVLENQANTWSTGLQHFGAATVLLPNAATLPATCSLGEIFVDNNETPAGQQVYICSAANTWSKIGDGGAGGSTHDILSATHTDSTAAAVSRGSLIVGIGASPKWEKLALGASGTFLKSDGTDAVWGSVNHHVGWRADNTSTNPTDSTTYYFGNTAWQTAQSDKTRLTVMIAGTIVEACSRWKVDGTLSSAQNVTFTLQKNDVDTAITWTDTWDNANPGLACGTGSVAIAVKDNVTLKMVGPAWTTNPTTVRQMELALRVTAP